MKDVDLRKIIHKHYIGTEITEMKVDAEGKVKLTESATLNNTTDHGDQSSEKDEEVREATH